MIDEQAYLDKLRNKYIDSSNKIDIKFYCYYDYYKDYMGCTRYRTNECEIYVIRALYGKNACTKAVLWHEFCHAESYIETGEKGHGLKFVGRLLRKPFMACIMPMVCIFWITVDDISRRFAK